MTGIIDCFELIFNCLRTAVVWGNYTWLDICITFLILDICIAYVLVLIGHKTPRNTEANTSVAAPKRNYDAADPPYVDPYWWKKL